MAKPRRRRISPGPCVLCTRVGPRTEEHIPPKNLWPKSQSIRKRCLWVPACPKCNSESARDDEYFRIVVAQNAETGEHPEVKLVEPAIARSLERPEFAGLRHTILSRAFPVELRTDAGLYVERRLAHMVDAKRVQRVISKIVRGLYFLESKTIMPESHQVSFIVPEQLDRMSLEQRVKAAQYVNAFQGRSFKVGGPGRVFQFSYIVEPQQNGVASLWLLVFFERLSFLAVAVPRAAAA